MTRPRSTRPPRRRRRPPRLRPVRLGPRVTARSRCTRQHGGRDGSEQGCGGRQTHRARSAPLAQLAREPPHPPAHQARGWPLTPVRARTSIHAPAGPRARARARTMNLFVAGAAIAPPRPPPSSFRRSPAARGVPPPHTPPPHQPPPPTGPHTARVAHRQRTARQYCRLRFQYLRFTSHNASPSHVRTTYVFQNEWNYVGFRKEYCI